MMSDRFWKKISYMFSLLPIGALFGVLVSLANLEIRDLDLWLHLGMGKFIALNHFVPDFDMLSSTIAGKLWINHEWLFQVIVYHIFNLFGADGLLKMQMVLVVATVFFLLLIGYNKDRMAITNFFLLIVLLLYQQRFTVRPDLFSLFFFAVYIFVLALHLDKKWVLPALFLVQVLWTNIHGFFFFGPLFVFIGLFSEWIRRRIRLPYEWNASGKLNDEEYLRLKVIFFIVSLACFFNPSFVQGVLYPLRVLFSLTGENKVFFEYIQELQRPISLDAIWSLGESRYYKLAIVLSFMTFIYNRRRIDISALFLWVIFLIFSLKAVRNIPFFAFAAYLVSVTNLFNIDFKDISPIRFSYKKFEYLTLIVFHLIMVLWIFEHGQEMTSRVYYDIDKYEKKAEFSGGIGLQGFPYKAVAFLKENNIEGNFFNDFNSGAYLIGNVFPRIKVFIDGRTEVYGGKFFKEYNQIWKDGNVELFEKYVKRYNLTGALLNSSRQYVPKEILDYFYHSQDWVLVYFDHDGLVFLRDIAKNKKWIDQFRMDLKDWKPLKNDLYKIGEQRAAPVHNYYRAYTLEALNLDEPARLELEEALKIAPDYFQVYSLLGKIYAKKKDYAKAFEYFRIKASITPADKENRFNLALAYTDLKEYSYAVKQYEIIVRSWPKDPKGYFLLSNAYLKNKEYDKAVKVLKEVYPKMSKSFKDATAIIESLCQEKVYSEAKELFDLVSKVEVNNETSKKDLEALKSLKCLNFPDNSDCLDVCSDTEK